MDLIFKIFGLGALIAVLNTVLEKADRKDVAFWLGLCATILAMMWVVPEVRKLLDMVTSFFHIR